MGTEAIARSWGTWEELLLGGAVIRYGTGNWNLVAAELQARIVFPDACTPEVCMAKYKDLLQRYIGCAWYEELRRRRMLELKQALELSEDSIGSLESKLDALKSSQRDKPVFNGSCQSESWGVVQKPKDELSAGSFTQEIRTCSSSECQPAPMSVEEAEIKSEGLQSCQWEKVPSVEKLGGILCEGKGGTLRKRRGKRKRKDCNKDVKEGSIGENNISETANPSNVTQSKENSCSHSFEVRGSSDANDVCRSSVIDGVDVLMAIFKSVTENKSASVFRKRLDSQKRGRYKKLIRRHLDMNMIRSRVTSGSLTTRNELYRDLLLLANNALVFYSRTTREYKAAAVFSDLILSKCPKLLTNSGSSVAQTNNLRSPIHDIKVKPSHLRLLDGNLSRKVGVSGDIKLSNGSKRKGSNLNSNNSLELGKKEIALETCTGVSGDVKLSNGSKRKGNNHNSNHSLELDKKEIALETCAKKQALGGMRKGAVGTSKSERSATLNRGRKRGRAK